MPMKHCGSESVTQFCTRSESLRTTAETYSSNHAGLLGAEPSAVKEELIRKIPVKERNPRYDATARSWSTSRS